MMMSGLGGKLLLHGIDSRSGEFQYRDHICREVIQISCHALDLDRQLPARTQDHGSYPLLGMLLLVIEDEMQDGDEEGARLSGSSASPGQDVFPLLDRQRNGCSLNRRRTLPSDQSQRLEQACIQSHVRELWIRIIVFFLP